MRASEQSMMITKMNNIHEDGKKNRGAASPNTLAVLSSLLNLILLLIIIETTVAPACGQQLLEAAPVEPGKRSFAGVMAVVAVLFFISGFLSLYTRQCGDRTTRLPPTRSRLDLALPFGRRHSMMEPRGLNPDVIDTFPTFLYATVKGLMVAKEALACAVCLDEFQDDETLRLIPICNHVFHPACIDAWLASNSTCPVCRANLVPTSEQEEEPPFVAVEIPEEDRHQQQNGDNYENENNNAVVAVGMDEETPKENVLRRMRRSYTMNNNNGRGTTIRSRSTGFLFGLLFPRSESRGGSVERICERFSVRLPEEIRRKLVVNDNNNNNSRKMLKRARSCVGLGRMGSGRSGYRTRSRFQEEQWEFALTTTPVLVFATSSSSPSLLHNNNNNVAAAASESEVAPSHDDNDRVLGERSSDYLCPGILASHLPRNST